MFEVTGSEPVVDAQEFILFILEHRFAMQDAFALLRNHFTDARPARLEIVYDILGFVEFRPILEDRITDPVAERIADAVGRHRVVAIVDRDLFCLQFDLSVRYLGIAKQPDELAVNAYAYGISGSIVDSGFNVALWRDRVRLNIKRIGRNIEGIGTVSNSIGRYLHGILPDR